MMLVLTFMAFSFWFVRGYPLSLTRTPPILADRMVGVDKTKRCEKLRPPRQRDDAHDSDPCILGLHEILEIITKLLRRQRIPGLMPEPKPKPKH